MVGNKASRNRPVGRIERPVMSVRDYSLISSFITSELGLKMPPIKKTMLQARLQKRLRALDLPSFSAYREYLFHEDNLDRERSFLYDAVTTNTTYFFREPKHFEILSAEVLPAMAAERPGGHCRVWSAGCSTGEEPYTLAMVLLDFMEQRPDFSFDILATDISTEALRCAAKAVYSLDKAGGIPRPFMMKYLLRSKDRSLKQVRMGPELREKIEFRRLNFMHDFGFQQPLDIIFCRNVVIYFDHPTQRRLFQKLCDQIRPGGYLFTGHSESIAGMDLPLAPVVPTVYRKVHFQD